MKKDVKIKAEFSYFDGGAVVTIVGLVDKKEFEESEFQIPGYVEGGDMQTDAEGFNMHTILEGKKELHKFYDVVNTGDGKWTGEVDWEVVD